MPRRFAFVALLAAFTACTDQRATTDQVSSASGDTIRVVSDGEGKWGPIHDAVERSADPTIKDSLHDSDAIGWAVFFGREALAAMLKDAAR